MEKVEGPGRAAGHGDGPPKIEKPWIGGRISRGDCPKGRTREVGCGTACWARRNSKGPEWGAGSNRQGWFFWSAGLVTMLLFHWQSCFFLVFPEAARARKKLVMHRLNL